VQLHVEANVARGRVAGGSCTWSQGRPHILTLGRPAEFIDRALTSPRGKLWTSCWRNLIEAGGIYDPSTLEPQEQEDSDVGSLQNSRLVKTTWRRKTGPLDWLREGGLIMRRIDPHSVQTAVRRAICVHLLSLATGSLMQTPGRSLLRLAAPQHPVIFIDDSGSTDARSWDGEDNQPRTPNIDTIAHAGVRSAMPGPCPNARPACVLFTGRYPLRTGVSTSAPPGSANPKLL